MHLLRLGLVLALCVSLVSAKSFLNQFISWSLGSAKSSENAKQDTTPISNCVCDGPGCVCCTDFNLTYIDLGGPGCVRLKYLSPEEGMAVNVSYGDSLLHSEVVKGPNPEPTCMDLLTDLAQVCARFTDLNPTADGMRGCVNMEPKLLGEATADYALGCFKVGPEGMTFDPPANNTRPATTAGSSGGPAPSTEGEEEEEEGPSEEEVIAAVNETAEQGLAFLGSLLGIDFGGLANGTETTTAATAEATSQASTQAPAGRALNPLINEV